MFSFLKGKTTTPGEASSPSSSDTDVARDVSVAPPTPSPEVATSAEADHPLAALVWDSPDVPRAEESPSSTSHGLDVGALVEPPPSASMGPGYGEKDQARTDALKPKIVEALSTIYDPEIPVNIYELGLIYDIVSDADGRVTVTMTLTSPACPSAQQLPSEARYKTKAVEGVTDAYVDVVWEPPWTKDLMSETAKLALGMF
jgi:FeS assembly SUF system protein